MKTTLTPDILDAILAQLARANAAHDATFPGEPADRQPVHVVYGGAHLFKTGMTRNLGSLALRLLETYAPDPVALANCVGLPADGELARKVYDRTVAKLRREPVEDYRIDFEDGYGYRPDAEEDGHAVAVAHLVARGAGQPDFFPFFGIRVKPLTKGGKDRSIRTLDLFLTALLDEARAIPQNFVVTIPKVTVREQASAAAHLVSALESRHGLKHGAVQLELMIETPESIFAIPELVAACEGRCRGLHFGAYDYTASCNITAEHQSMDHPVCDFARHVMQVTTAGRGLMLSDGATNILPIPKHRGASLTDEQTAENRAVVHRAMRLHFAHVQRSLANGFYQGWDLHPGQLPTRYAAVYAFFLQSLGAAAARLKNFVEKAAQATRAGEVFDDAATGQGLLNFFLRGINCGAFTEEEACSSGLTLEELRSRSFVEILKNRLGR